MAEDCGKQLEAVAEWSKSCWMGRPEKQARGQVLETGRRERSGWMRCVLQAHHARPVGPPSCSTASLFFWDPVGPMARRQGLAQWRLPAKTNRAAVPALCEHRSPLPTGVLRPARTVRASHRVR